MDIEKKALRRFRVRVWHPVFYMGVLAAIGLVVAPQVASAGPVTLGAAANFAVFGMADSSSSDANLVMNSLVTINGNEGIGQFGKIDNMAPSVINGNVDEYSAGEYSGPGKLKGSLSTNAAALMTDGADIDAAILQMGSLTNSGGSYTKITSATTINAVGPQTVVDVGTGGINLNNANLTIHGAAGNQVIIRVSGGMNMVGTASVKLTGGITANDVFFDFTGSGNTIQTKVGDVLYGVYIAPNDSMTLDGTFNGEIIGGENITLMSGITINGVTAPTPTPEPSSLLLLGSGLLGLGVVVRRRSAARDQPTK
jgi:PEP-CTERM motif